MANAIEINNLTKSYGKSRGIIDMNLSIKEGEFFGFIGPNGAGKSTTIRTLLGLIFPTSGNASVLGHDIILEKKQLLTDVGYLPSEASFYSGMKVKDVLEFAADMRRVDCSATTTDLCTRLQLDSSRKVDELSFGNRKKVAIVCALQHNPKLLILDEPTSGLDPLMQKEFFDILRERNKEGTSIFLSSHILSEIQHNCGRAAIIREGRIIACDNVEALAKTNAKRVSVQISDDVSSLFGVPGDDAISSLVGVRDIRRTPDGVSFLYTGDINTLVKKLATCNISDLSIAEPELEEIFMHYYSDGGDKK